MPAGYTVNNYLHNKITVDLNFSSSFDCIDECKVLNEILEGKTFINKKIKDEYEEKLEVKEIFENVMAGEDSSPVYPKSISIILNKTIIK